MANVIDSLKDKQAIVVRIKPDYRAKDGVIVGTVHKGRNYFYISPVGDSHPGSCVTKQEIIEIVL